MGLCQSKEQYTERLIAAAVKGQLGVVMKLIKYGIDVNEPSRGVRSHHIEEVLVAAIFWHCQGRTALMAACKNGREEVVDYLLSAGADVNAKTLVRNYDSIFSVLISVVCSSAGQLSIAHATSIILP
jgi:ankyrin repeat protein